MSDTGNYNSSMSSQLRDRHDYEANDGHGATIVLNTSGGEVYHNQSGFTKRVLIRSYKDGMRVGCTFITNEAFDRLCEYRRRYVNRTDYEQHQAGY